MEIDLVLQSRLTDLPIQRRPIQPRFSGDDEPDALDPFRDRLEGRDQVGDGFVVPQRAEQENDFRITGQSQLPSGIAQSNRLAITNVPPFS